MQTLITGSTGFVGQNLVNYLHDDCNNIALNRKELQSIFTDGINNYNSIIHLAGKAHDLKRTSNPEEYYQVNFELTQKLYDVFLTSNAKKFIFVSSVKAVADVTDQILTEDAIPDPRTDYGKSKLMAEQYIQNQPLPLGKSFYILRPCMIHGPGNKGNLNLLYQVVKKGVPYPLAGFDNKRSFLSIDNLCYCIREILTRQDISSGIYNIADDDALSTNEVVSILASSLNKKPLLWSIPPRFISFLAKIGDVLHLPLTTERLNKLTENYVVSNYKIKTALHKSLPLNAKDGLRITAASFSK